MEEQKLKKILYASAGLLVAVLLLLVGTAINRFTLNQAVAKEEEGLAQANKVNPFSQVKLEAKAAVVYDVESGQVLYSREGEAQLPLASLTKAMTAMIASERMPASTIINISEEALATEGDSGLKAGDGWYLHDLIDYMLVTSSNDGARAIALNTEELTNREFVGLMNERADSLGLSQTYFWNETGLDDNPVKPGAMGSANDMAKLFSHILKSKPEILAATNKPAISTASFDTRYHGINTNALAATLPSLIGSKTGYTDLAGGNLAVVIDAGLRQPVVIVVLGSSQEGRFSDVRKLTAATHQYLANQ